MLQHECRMLCCMCDHTWLLSGDAWWTRYQPVSYNLTSRSGSPKQFKGMVQRCRAAHVQVYAGDPY